MRLSAGRWVRCAGPCRATGSFLFTLPPEFVDANIHPAKAEVRFRYPGEIFDTVQQAALNLSGGVPQVSPGAFSP